MKNLVSIKNLSVGFQSQKNKLNVVNSISFEIPKGKTVALVGESGSGKTVTALSILKLLPYPSAFHDSGEIIYNDIDLLKSKSQEIQKIRGKNISAIFQEPMTSLNPLHTIEKQINEILMIHSSISYLNAKIKTEQLLNQVGLTSISKRIKSYPHELSGGQRQRVMIAMSIANNPDLLIADGPTTALDVTVQSQILDLIKNLQKKITTSGCALGTIFGDIYDDIKKTNIKSKKKIKHSWIYDISKKINLTPSLYLEAGAVHGCAIIHNNNPLIYMEDNRSS